LRGDALDAQALSEPEARHAVDQAEIDRLRGTPLVLAYLVERQAEHLGRGRAMHVVAMLERVAQPFVARNVRHDPQLDLRVVRRENLPSGPSDERLADPPPLRR